VGCDCIEPDKGSIVAYSLLQLADVTQDSNLNQGEKI